MLCKFDNKKASVLISIVSKDYSALAAAINKNYPTIYSATSNEVGVVVAPITMHHKVSLPHAANFLEGCVFIKGKNFTISAIVEDGLICIQ